MAAYTAAITKTKDIETLVFKVNKIIRGERNKICTYLKHYQKKWQPVLEHPDLPKITDTYKRAVTSVILENQERALKEDAQFMTETAPTNSTGASIANWDPILIS